MGNDEVERLDGMMSKIAYEMHDKEYVDESLRELLLDFWREFYLYEQ